MTDELLLGIRDNIYCNINVHMGLWWERVWQRYTESTQKIYSLLGRNMMYMVIT